MFNEQFVLCKIILVNFSRFQWDKWINSYQCITVRQRTARYPFVLQSALFLCTFSIIHCGNLYFFKLHVFHVALFSCYTFFILHHFHAALFCIVMFSCCTFFRVALFLRIALFHVALFSSCTLFILQYFQKCCKNPHKHLRSRGLQQ